MPQSPLYLTEADVARLVTVEDALASLQEAFAAWRDPGTTNLPRQRANLSGREMEVLQLLTKGRSNKEISARLGISVKTIETYKARAMEKLGFKSRVDVVRHAASKGWLPDA